MSTFTPAQLEAFAALAIEQGYEKVTFPDGRVNYILFENDQCRTLLFDEETAWLDCYDVCTDESARAEPDEPEEIERLLRAIKCEYTG